MGVVSRWVWVDSTGVVARWCIDFLILFILIPLVSALFCSIPTLFFFKMFFVVMVYSYFL